MRAKRQTLQRRRGDGRRHPDGAARAATRRGTAPSPSRESRAPRSGPLTAVTPRRAASPKPARNATQAKARANARKAKAPKVVRIPLRERLTARLAAIDLRPRTLAAKVPFVVLVIGALAAGLGITLWLSTDAAERSYQLGAVREGNRVLLQQKEALERDVREAQSAPALAEAARNLGMIPSRDTAHLVQDPVGNWVVIGSPAPAEGAPPPPLNTKLPEERPAPPTAGAPAAPPPALPRPLEVPIRVPPGLGFPGMTATGPEVLLRPAPSAPIAQPAEEAEDAPHLPIRAGLGVPGTLAGPRPGPRPAVAPSLVLPPIVIGPPAGMSAEQFGPPAVSPSATTPGFAR